MPKFLVTNGSNFQPFTYEEITRPLYEMAEAHRASQDQYDAISTQTEALRNYITDNPGDKQAKQMYDNYVNKLKTLQDNLWSTGYNASTRRDLQSARAGFASDINRIGKAIENRQARSAEYNKFKHEHPDMVMGEDPGLSGLDAYLGNDLYGTNWYQYSGNQFTKEVAQDAGNRVKEMFNDPEMSRTIPGYITIKKQQGVTSEDVAKANEAVSDYLSGRADGLNGLDPVQSILAKVLLEHLDSTGAANKVTPEEFARLVDYGKSGLSAAIGTSEYQNLKDLVFEANLEFNNWKRKKNYELNNGGSGSGSSQAGLGAFDYHTRKYTGENQEKANKQTQAYDMSSGSYKVTRNGQVMNDAMASELVYSGNLRREAYNVLGFDIGRSEDANGLAPDFIGNSMLQGHIEHNGVEYDVRYNRKKSYNGEQGVIQTRKAGEGWKISPQLTDYYKAKRSEYEETLNDYKNNHKDVYDLATINPDKQYRDYRKQDEPFQTPLTEFRSDVMNRPENMSGEIREPYIARRGTDSDYIDRFSSFISSSFNLSADSKGKVTAANDKSLDKYDGTSSGIHLIKSNGDLDDKTITDPSDVFTFDNKDYKVTNIRELRLSPQSIMDIDLSGYSPAGGYIIAELTDGREVSLGLNMFDSMALYSTLAKSRSNMDRIINDPVLSDRDKAIEMVIEANNASRMLRSAIGYYLQLGSPSGTSAKDNN